MDEKKSIIAFVEHLRENGFPGLQVDRWPDEENRNSRDIDAVTGPFAIEHTSIDTIENLRRDSEWFMQVVGSLNAEISHKLLYRLTIILPYKGIQKGQNWQGIRDAFKAWVDNSSTSLLDGTHNISGVPGVPFDFRVIKATDRKPGLFFRRSMPEDQICYERLRCQLTDKAEKLAPYKQKDKTTILLVESEDITLMDECTMVAAIRTSFSNSLPKDVDEVWYVDTSIPSELVFHNFTVAIQSEGGE